MKKLLLSLFLCSFAFGQSGIRSLNGSLLNSQRLVLDTTAGSFSVSVSNGVHTISIPLRVASGGLTDTITYTSLSSGLTKNLTSTVGMYRLVYTIFCTTADAAAGSVQLTLSFNNGAAQTMTSASVNLTSTANKDDDVFVFYVASGTPTVTTAITGSAGTSKHSVHAIVERLK